ncbi:MAG: DUF3303 domain-containing protein [Phycisphaerales bacterium]
MLFHITESFRNGADEIGKRFAARGRLMPEGCGIEVIASWMDTDATRCFMIIAAPERASLDGWIANWSDLVSFEVSQIVVSSDFWAARRAADPGAT